MALQSKKFICKKAFIAIEIHPDGKVYPCCPAWINNYDFGNIFEGDFESIYNSKRAKDFRKSVMAGEYTFCNLDYCQGSSSFHANTVVPEFISSDGMTARYPSFVKFCHDISCNQRCITCRDAHTTNSKEKNQQLDSHIESRFLPTLKDAEIVSLNGCGEVFASSHCRTLIKEIARTYPNIKFDLHTNGILCNEKRCRDLGILDKLTRVQVSVHAVSEEVHRKITRTGGYKNVFENIQWLSNIKKQGMLRELRLVFVVSGINYQEMKPFMEMAIKLDAIVDFWEYRPWGTELDDTYNELAVFRPDNKDYKRLAKILKDDVFKHPNCCMDGVLRDVDVSKAAGQTIAERALGKLRRLFT